MQRAALQVTAEIRVLDAGDHVERVFRLTRAIDEAGVRLHRDVPWEPGRAVRVELAFPWPDHERPDEDRTFAAIGRVAGVAPDDESTEGQQAVPRAITFTSIDEAARQRLAAYVEERTQTP